MPASDRAAEPTQTSMCRVTAALQMASLEAVSTGRTGALTTCRVPQQEGCTQLGIRVLDCSACLAGGATMLSWPPLRHRTNLLLQVLWTSHHRQAGGRSFATIFAATCTPRQQTFGSWGRHVTRSRGRPALYPFFFAALCSLQSMQRLCILSLAGGKAPPVQCKPIL